MLGSKKLLYSVFEDGITMLLSPVIGEVGILTKF